MGSQHHCNKCPYWCVTKKKYQSGFYNITICRKYRKQIFYLAGSINKTPCPCSMCEKEFSYVPYIEQWILQEVKQVAERLTVKAPSGLIHLVNNSESGMNQAIKKLAEYETAEEEGRLVVLPCKVGTRVYEIYQFCGYGAWEIEEHKIKLEDLNKIGKTVFLTREKAEKSIERNEG